MAKTKQTRRMMAMALAAAVTMSSMPVTAFAETTVTDNGDGTTTTTTNTVSGDNTPSSPQVTEVKSETKTEGGYVTETKTSTTTESTTRQNASDNTEPGITNVKVEVVTNTYTGGSSVTQVIDEYSNEKTSDTQVNSSENTNGNSGDPTGNGQNMDLDGDGVISDTEKFVSDFMEGTTITNESQTERENHEEHYDEKDSKDRPTENSGSVSGSETFTDTETTVTKTEVDNPDDARNSDGTPELTGTTGPTLKEEGTYVKVPVVDADGNPVLDGTGNPVYETVLANPEVPTLTVPDAGDITVDLDRANENANGVTTNTVTVSVYENVVGQLKDGLDKDIVDDFKADFGDEVVITTDGDKADITKPVTYTATRTDADGNTIKTTVTLTPQTVVIGDKTYVTGYTTEKAEEITPKDSKLVSDNTIITNQDFAYDFDDLTVDGGTEGKPVVTTKTVVELPEDMPEEGAVSSRVNEQGHTETTTVVYIRETIDGEEKVTGYKNVVVVTDENGKEFGGGEDVHNFKKSVVTTTSTKEVVKTTTIDTDTQQTIVTTKEITKNVTTSTATVDVQKLEREVIASMFGFNTTFGATDINSLQVTEHRDGNAAGTDGLHSIGTEYFKVNNGEVPTADMIQYIQHALRSDYRINLQDHNTSAYMYELQNADRSESFYGYCVDLATTAYRGFFYEIENLEDQDYYQQNSSGAVMSTDATDRLRAIALNGYWATESGTGSLDAVKQLLRDNGYENIADGLTPGEALAATQAALWKYGNSDDSDSVNESNITSVKDTESWYDAEGRWYRNNIENTAADNRIQALYEVLTSLNGITKDAQNAGTNILDDSDILSSAIKVGDFQEEKDVNNDGTADKVYDTDLTFKLAVVPNETGEGFTVLVKQGNSATQTFDMQKLDKTTDEDGNTTFTLPNVKLAEGVKANITFEGTQNLSQGVYLYTSELEEVPGDGISGDVPSQTFISVASGSRQVTVDLNMNFTVKEPEAVTSSSSKHHTKKKTNKYETINTFHDQDVDVKTLVEVTQTVTTTLSNEWSGEYEQTWSYNGGGNDPKDPTPDPKDPEPTPNPEDPGMIIPDEDVPLADIGEEEVPLVAGAEDVEEPMVLGAEEEAPLIAATGDSNHMAAGFGGMFAALAGMFMLRRKKEQ